MWVFCSGRNPKGDLLVGLVIFGQTELLCRSGLHGLSGLASEAGAVAQLVAVGGRREATGGHRDQLTPTLTLTFLHTLNWAAARREERSWWVTSLKIPPTSPLPSDITLVPPKEPTGTSEKAVNPNYSTKGHQSSWLSFLCALYTQECSCLWLKNVQCIYNVHIF